MSCLLLGKDLQIINEQKGKIQQLFSNFSLLFIMKLFKCTVIQFCFSLNDSKTFINNVTLQDHCFFNCRRQTPSSVAILICFEQDENIYNFKFSLGKNLYKLSKVRKVMPTFPNKQSKKKFSLLVEEVFISYSAVCTCYDK